MDVPVHFTLRHRLISALTAGPVEVAIHVVFVGASPARDQMSDACNGCPGELGLVLLSASQKKDAGWHPSVCISGDQTLNFDACSLSISADLATSLAAPDNSSALADVVVDVSLICMMLLFTSSVTCACCSDAVAI